MAKTESMSNEKLLQKISDVFDKKTKETKRHFGVVAEGLEKQIGAIAEQHGSVMGKLGEHDKRFDSITETQEAIKTELEGVKLAVQDNRVEIKSVKSELGKINQKLDTKLEDHEERISDVEHRVGIA